MRQTISVLDARCPWQDTPTEFLSSPEKAGLRLPIQQLRLRVLRTLWPISQAKWALHADRIPLVAREGGPMPVDPTACRATLAQEIRAQRHQQLDVNRQPLCPARGEEAMDVGQRRAVDGDVLALMPATRAGAR